MTSQCTQVKCIFHFNILVYAQGKLLLNIEIMFIKGEMWISKSIQLITMALVNTNTFGIQDQIIRMKLEKNST